MHGLKSRVKLRIFIDKRREVRRRVRRSKRHPAVVMAAVMMVGFMAILVVVRCGTMVFLGLFDPAEMSVRCDGPRLL